MKTLSYISKITLLIAIIILISGCGRKTQSGGTRGYSPEPCEDNQEGWVLYVNDSRKDIMVSCKRVHANLTVKANSTELVHNVPANVSYNYEYWVYKKEHKKRKGTFRVGICEHKKVYLD